MPDKLPDDTTQQQVRRLTQGEVAVMDRALRRSTRLVHAGELASASIGEQPDCTEQARAIVASLQSDCGIYHISAISRIADALSAVHSKYQATIASLRREIDEAKAALDAVAQSPSPGPRNE